MFNKSMDFIRRSNRENFYFSSQSSQIWWQISGIEVRKTHKISAQYIKNTGTWGVNATINKLIFYIIFYK